MVRIGRGYRRSISVPILTSYFYSAQTLKMESLLRALELCIQKKRHAALVLRSPRAPLVVCPLPGLLLSVVEPCPRRITTPIAYWRSSFFIVYVHFSNSTRFANYQTSYRIAHELLLRQQESLWNSWSFVGFFYPSPLFVDTVHNRSLPI